MTDKNTNDGHPSVKIGAALILKTHFERDNVQFDSGSECHFNGKPKKVLRNARVWDYIG